MAHHKGKFNSELTTGFGTSSNDSAGRFYRKDGSVNVVRHGVPFLDRFSWFHTWLSMSRLKFWASLGGLFIFINFIFAFVYYFIGIDHLDGIRSVGGMGKFAEAFFFSTQTFTTVGYGHISPKGFTASTISALEAFMGWLFFALASGLFYGRFSMPRAFIYFSDVALISPYKEGQALMFRMVPFKNNQLTDAEIKLTLALRIKEGDRERNEFYTLPVEFSKINVLVLNWTVVHAINEESPLYGLTLQDLKDTNAELLVFMKAYDEVFANNVVARTSYTASEFIFNARFRPMYHSSTTHQATVLEIDKLNEFELL